MSNTEWINSARGESYGRALAAADRLVNVDPENPLLDVYDVFNDYVKRWGKNPPDAAKVLESLASAMEKELQRAATAKEGGILLVFKVDGKRDYYEY
jgi:hypothetical protein